MNIIQELERAEEEGGSEREKEREMEEGKRERERKREKERRRREREKERELANHLCIALRDIGKYSSTTLHTCTSDKSTQQTTSFIFSSFFPSPSNSYSCDHNPHQRLV